MICKRKKKDKVDIIQIKSISSKYIKRMKGVKGWEKIFVSYIMDIGLISIVYKELTKLNSKE